MVAVLGLGALLGLIGPGAAEAALEHEACAELPTGVDPLHSAVYFNETDQNTIFAADGGDYLWFRENQPGRPAHWEIEDYGGGYGRTGGAFEGRYDRTMYVEANQTQLTIWETNRTAIGHQGGEVQYTAEHVANCGLWGGR